MCATSSTVAFSCKRLLTARAPCKANNNATAAKTFGRVQNATVFGLSLGSGRRLDRVLGRDRWSSCHAWMGQRISPIESVQPWTNALISA